MITNKFQNSKFILKTILGIEVIVLLVIGQIISSIQSCNEKKNKQIKLLKYDS